MKHSMKRALLYILAAAMALCAFPAAASASKAAASETIDITYHFNPDKLEIGRTATGEVTWRDDCFLRSSFLGCSHLAEVSAAASLASRPYTDSSLTPAQSEALAPKYVKEYLEAAHFEDVETNKYYTVRQEENSVGAAFGRKDIQDDDTTYTLLAIVIRSMDYTQEWAGNFDVTEEGESAGGMHAGFKAARDEVLRYAARYMKDHDIVGCVKVWITGHSRGAAISNALGGFFAGGGDAYFQAQGIPISITPENVYCYTFSPPRTIRQGLTHAEDLSVAGNRADYPNDTPGKAYAGGDTGAVDPKASCYSGIRNYPKFQDVITKLPPSMKDWNYTYYGRVCSFDSSDLEGGPVAESEMLAQLRVLDPDMYRSYINGGSPNDYKRVILDPGKLLEAAVSGEGIDISKIMKSTDKGPATMGDMMQGRVDALASVAASPQVFADKDYQHAVQALAALFGMVSPDLSDPDLPAGDLAKGAVYCLLDYAVTRMREEDPALRNKEEDEVIARFLEKLLACLFPDESIPEDSLCLAGIVEMAARYIFPKSGDTQVSKKVLEALAKQFPDPDDPGAGAQIVYAYFNAYLPQDKDPGSYTKEERIGAFLKACGWGPVDKSRAKESGETARDVSCNLCNLINLASMAGMLELPDWAKKALSSPNNPGAFPGQVRAVLEGLMPEGETYGSLSEAADTWGKRAVGILYEGPLDRLAAKGYSKAYIRDARRHFENMKTYIRPLRSLLTAILFSTPGESLSAEGMIRNASLIAANVGIVGTSHYDQVDLAWAAARRAKGIWDHAVIPTPTPKPPPETGDSARPLLWLLMILGGLGMCTMAMFISAGRKRK